MIDRDQISQRFERDKQIIIKNIISASHTPPQAIILCGGYGRGEGAWYEDSKGKICPYNDYDIAVITESSYTRETCQELRKKIADEIGIRWIDIDFYTKKQMKRFKSTIHNIDLYEGSTLLWGNHMWRSEGKVLDHKKIGIEDLLILYRTRMWTLLGSWEGDFRDIEGEDARFFRNQMAKCILASCDMRLVKLKKYNSSYRERVRLIIQEFPEDIRICKLSKWAINEKLNPSSRKLSKEEMKQLYSESLNEFKKSFSYAMEHKAKYVLNPSKTNKYIKFRTLYFAHRIFSILSGRKDIVSKTHDLFIAQNYILNAFNIDGNHNQDYITKASQILQKWGYIYQEEANWNRVRVIVAKARNNI